MNILEKIIIHKKNEIGEAKTLNSIAYFEQQTLFNQKCASLKEKIKQQKFGVIAELKRKSPSKGWLHKNLNFEATAKAYEKSGAVALSVLTDEEFFGGKLAYLKQVKTLVEVPLLRKDFIVDEYQLYQAKAFGADIVLLIAAALSIEATKNLSVKAKQLGLEILLEVHNENELDHINEYVDFVGVNNRNLSTFEVSIETSLKLANKIPNGFVKVSESGITNAEEIKQLKDAGYELFLIGEHFMKNEQPGLACESLIETVNELLQ